MLSDKTIELKKKSDNDRTLCSSFLDSLAKDLKKIFKKDCGDSEILDDECLKIFIKGHQLDFYIDDVDIYFNGSFLFRVNVSDITGDYNNIIDMVSYVLDYKKQN